MKEYIQKLIDGIDLTQNEAYDAMKIIMDGLATPSQIAGFLTALRMKGETVEEIAGCALSMRDAARPLGIHKSNIVDNCGTGGDGQNGLNVSTAAAFVAAGAGLTVAKHGNRAISSKCGSADVLEALGVKIDAPSANVEHSIDQVGIGFLFAPSFHPAMRYAMPTRKELGVRTVFNLLGPLTNPAHAKVQLIGVYKPELTKTIAEVLVKMKHLAGLVVHSEGWDEVTLDKPTIAIEVYRGKIKSMRWTAKDFGLPKVASKFLKVNESVKNAEIIHGILEGKEHPARPVVVANAAALIYIAAKGYGPKTISLREAVKQAEESIDNGSALKKLLGMAEISHQFN